MSATPPDLLSSAGGREVSLSANGRSSSRCDKERSRSKDRGRDKDKERDRKRRDRDRDSRDRDGRRRDRDSRERDRDRDSHSNRSRSRNHDDYERRRKRSRSRDRDRKRDRDSRSRRSNSRSGDYDRSRRRRSRSRSYERRRSDRSRDSQRNSRERSSRDRDRERIHVNPFDTSSNRSALLEQETRIPSLFERQIQQPSLETIREETRESRFDLSQTIQELMGGAGAGKGFASFFSNQNSNDSMSNGPSENSMDSAAERKRKRKSRWGGNENDKTFIPGMPTILPSTLDPAQQEAYLVQFQIEEISRKLRTGDLGITQNPEERFENSSDPCLSSPSNRKLSTHIITATKHNSPEDSSEGYNQVLMMHCTGLNGGND